METMQCERSLTVNKSADEVWEWVSDPRNAMTANQFHESIKFDGLVTGPGPVIPIQHNIFGRRHVRLARVTRFEKYAFAWGERMEEGLDAFPHSTAFQIIPEDAGHCTVVNVVRGRWNLPVGHLIGPYVWEKMMPITGHNDLQDVAFALGAIQEKEYQEYPPDVPGLLRLMSAKTIDSIPVDQLFLASAG